jgi:hypothetical protein
LITKKKNPQLSDQLLTITSEGDAPLPGFSPRKAEFSLSVTSPGNDDKKLLDKLGKYKMGKACIYFKF